MEFKEYKEFVKINKTEGRENMKTRRISTRLIVNCKRALKLMICAICCSLFILAANAQDTPTSDSSYFDLSLEELLNVKVISASKSLTSISAAPSVMSVITADDISKQGLKTLEEVLQRVPGFFTSEGGTRAIISNRGILTNKFLMLIDGHSVNSIVKDGMSQQHIFPLLDNIERIEIVRGPGSTLWGSEAALGVINIITKNDWDEIIPSEFPYGRINANYDYASNIKRNVAKLSYTNKLGKNGGVSLTGSWFNSDPEWLNRYSAGKATDNSFVVGRTAAVVHRDFNDSWEMAGKIKLGSLLISGRTTNFNSMSVMLTSTGTPERNGHFEYKNSFIDTKYTFEIGTKSNLDLRVYYDWINNYAIGDVGSVLRFVRSEEEGIGSEMIYTSNYFKNHEIKAGVQFRSVKTGNLDERRFSNDTLIKHIFWAKSGTDNNYDFFAEDTWNISDKWIAVAGMRLDYNDSRDKTINFLPRIGLIWLSSDRFTLKYLYNTGYVRPYIQQNHGTDGEPYWNEDFNTYWVGANKSEKISSHDFQVLYNFENIYIGATFYYLSYDKFIAWAGIKYQSDPNYTAYFQNFNEVTSKGVELDFNIKLFDPLVIYGNYSYTHARLSSMIVDLPVGGTIDVTGKPWVEPNGAFTGVPEHTWNLGLNYRIIKDLNFNMHYRGWTNAWALETNLPKYKKFGPEHYVDFNLWWNEIFKSPISLSLYCKDVFDNTGSVPPIVTSGPKVPAEGNVTGQPTLKGVLPGFGRIIGLKLNFNIGGAKNNE